MKRTYKRAELYWGSDSISFSNKENNPSTEFYLTDFKGWFGGVGVKGANEARRGHGDFQSRKHRGPRSITLEATIVCEDEEARDEMDRFVSGILWDGQPGILIGTMGEQTLSTEVELAGDIGHQYVGARSLKIQVPLKAPDPFLYGEKRTSQVFPAGFGEGLAYPLFGDGVITFDNTTSNSQVTITNKGNAEAFPVFETVNNFPSGIRIDDGRGNAIELPTYISRSAPVRVDMKGYVLVNGVDHSHALTRHDWFTVAPGETIQPRITSLQEGDGWVNIEISDTYI